jgi:hypothetical protein
MRRLNLYTTLGCHLCEEAAAMVNQQQPADLTLVMVEISESEKLLQEYGMRIPVLKFQDSEEELAWPFTMVELGSFIEAKAENAE